MKPGTLRILSIDHRMPMIELAAKLGVDEARIARFKELVVDACLRVANGRAGFGMFLDGGHGASALAKARAAGLWTARPIDRPHARPLDFEGSGDLSADLANWPAGVVVKCAVYLHPDDPEDILSGADRALVALDAACQAQKRDLLLETLASPHGPVDESTIAGLMTRIHRLGVKPRWWLIEDQPGPCGWRNVADVVAAHDPACEGFLTIARTIESFPPVVAAARRESMTKGFCAGRCMFAETAEPWLLGRIDDAAAVVEIADRFAEVVAMWDAFDAGEIA